MEFHARHSFLDQAVHGVGPAAAHTDHFDAGARAPLFLEPQPQAFVGDVEIGHCASLL